MPAEKNNKRKVPSSIPDHGDPERKRVLNVLAQRRYRQRRREKLAALEVQAGIVLQSKSEICPPATLQIDDPIEEIERGHTSYEEVVMTIDEAVSGYDATQSLFTYDQDALDVDLMQSFSGFVGCLPSPIPTTPSPSPSELPFADGAVLSIPILGVIRALSSVAIAFDVVQHLWDPAHLHVLPSSITQAMVALPKNLHPVPAQLLIPHHPLLDLLPWPSVREKLICMLSLPSSLRPPIAREAETETSGDPANAAEALDVTTGTIPGMWGSHYKQESAMVQLVQDLDDLQDGVGTRVHGNSTSWDQGNELVEEAWEIGGAFYKKWWWCIDQRIVENSNRRRRERGLPRLSMTT